MRNNNDNNDICSKINFKDDNGMIVLWWKVIMGGVVALRKAPRGYKGTWYCPVNMNVNVGIGAMIKQQRYQEYHKKLNQT